ncbi:MAG: putative reductase [uncultured Pseudonocardia sp.]|uniref:Putative reductase n=1 Tax=uncultured Pseudonocardia sp. TaxID=211455 RepID=A0A6J4QVN3_9PSEU|nr:MAG: putative reductase [uncultured Pseudonocardia sp.]
MTSLLLLGGSSGTGGSPFVGPALAEEALAAGWDVSVLHRGHHAPPRPAVSLIGDRKAPAGLAALEDGTWDVVVDTWAGAPSAVRDACRLLAGRIGHYVYISSRSVYDFPFPPPLHEGRPVVTGSPDDGEVEYRYAKRGGELAVSASFEQPLLVRPGIIFGPGEHDGRLPWWLRRIAAGGTVLAPGPPDSSVQYIDVRDLAAWTLDAAGRGLAGTFNLVCPPDHTTMAGFLEACVHVTDAGTDLQWTDPATVLASGLRPWSDLPVWLPPGDHHDLLHCGDVSKAVAAGLRCRPVGETVADTWAAMTGRA